MTNFIRLQYAEFLEEYTDMALFLGHIGTDQIFTAKNIEDIDGLTLSAGRDQVCDSVLPFLYSIGLSLKDIAEIYNVWLVGNSPYEFETEEEFHEENIANVMDAINFDLSEFISNIFYYIEKEQNDKGQDLTEAFLDYLGLEAFTVGYSPWSLVVTYKGCNKEFYDDLYNGWNFYDLVSIDETGEVLDSIGAVYARNEKELTEAVSDYFGFEKFKLIDNEEADVFNITKAVQTITYK